MKFLPLTACIIVGSAALPAFATQYLSVEEAQKAMFPDASSFRSIPVKLSNEQMQQIEKLAGVPARSVEWRVVAAYSGDRLLGHVVFDDVIGKFELISYAVALTPDANIKQIEILAYRESHGFEIRNTAWRKQFEGKGNAQDLAIGKGINNISGATLSCTHVTDGIRRISAIGSVVLRKT